MNMTERDKKALILGAGGVALILFVGYVLSPLLRSWSESRDLLQDRHAEISQLREKLVAQDALRTRRDVLALRIGSLRVLQPPKVEPEKPKGDEKPETSSAKPEEGEENSKNVPDDADNGAEKVHPVAGDGDEGPETSPKHSVEGAPSAATKGGGKTASPDELAETSGDKPALPSTSLSAKGAEVAAADSKPEEKEDESAPPENVPTNGEKDKTKKEKKEKAKKPPKPTVAASSLATYFEKNAKAAQVKIKRITPKKNTTGKKKTTHFDPVTIQVSFECKVKNLVTLLQSLESGELFTRVDQMEINRDLSKGDLLTASLSISSYEPVRKNP